MSKEGRVYLEVNGVTRVEYACECGGYFRFNKDAKRIKQHGQLPHTCTVCRKLVYFVIPYPALSYKGRIFVDFDTMRGEV